MSKTQWVALSQVPGCLRQEYLGAESRFLQRGLTLGDGASGKIATFMASLAPGRCRLKSRARSLSTFLKQNAKASLVVGGQRCLGDVRAPFRLSACGTPQARNCLDPVVPFLPLFRHKWLSVLGLLVRGFRFAQRLARISHGSSIASQSGADLGSLLTASHVSVAPTYYASIAHPSALSQSHVGMSRPQQQLRSLGGRVLRSRHGGPRPRRGGLGGGEGHFSLTQRGAGACECTRGVAGTNGRSCGRGAKTGANVGGSMVVIASPRVVSERQRVGLLVGGGGGLGSKGPGWRSRHGLG